MPKTKTTTEESVENRLTRETAMENNLTPQGKKLKIFHVSNTSLYKIAFEDGGQRAQEISGLFTSPHLAQEQITKYLKRRWADADKGEVDAGSASEGEAA